MPNLWNSISEKLRQALPEGERFSFARDVRGYVDHQGSLVIHATDHDLLMRIRQDYGALLSRAAQSAGLAGDVRYVEEHAHVGFEAPQSVEAVVEPDPLTQLSLFDSSASAVSTERQEVAEPLAAFRVSSFQDAREAMEQLAPLPVDLPRMAPAAPAALSQVDLDHLLEAASLSKRCTLDTWSHGEENRLVFRAALDIAHAASPDHLLYIHGGNGVGKTHLLNAIGVAALAHQPSLRVRHMTAESFVTRFIESIGSNQTASEFRFMTRDSVDLLLIDDIGFLEGKGRTQEEFLHVLRHHQERGNRVVVTSDRLPMDLKGLPEALRSRLNGGVVFGVDAPEVAARREILARLAADYRVALPNDVLDYIAMSVRTNVTELRGYGKRILSVARNTSGGIDLDMAKQQLAKVYSEASVTLTPESIFQATLEHYGVDAKSILSRSRTKGLVTPRKVAMYLVRSLTDLSYPEVGKFFDGRDHTTIMHSFNDLEKRLMTEPELQAAVQKIERRLGVARH